MRQTIRFAPFLLVAATAWGDDARVHLPVRARVSESGQRAATIRVGTELVSVPVTVLDGRGAPVRGLGRYAFRIFEDGVEQNVVTFGGDETPVSTGIVFDASKSMAPKLGEAREAVKRLFEQAIPGDEYHLVEFNDSARLLCDLTSDTGLVSTALSRVAARGWTALFDGVLLSAQSLRHAQNPRRALVVLSDGEDNFSRYGEGELRNFLREAGVVVYAIGLATGRFPTFQPKYLRRLAEETGGWCYTVTNIEGLGATVRAISEAIRSQYILTYSSSNNAADGKYRRIRVQLDSAGHTDWSNSWRAGYYAPLSR